MKLKTVLFAATAALAVGAITSARADHKPEKENSAADNRGDNEHKGGKNHKKDHDGDKHHADNVHHNNSECGLGRREHDDESGGGRDPDAERGDNCPAMEDHGKSDDDHGDRYDDHHEDRADEDDDSDIAENDDGSEQSQPDRKKRRWRWPWEPKDD